MPILKISSHHQPVDLKKQSHILIQIHTTEFFFLPPLLTRMNGIIWEKTIGALQRRHISCRCMFYNKLVLLQGKKWSTFLDISYYIPFSEKLIYFLRFLFDRKRVLQDISQQFFITLINRSLYHCLHFLFFFSMKRLLFL